MYIYINLTDTPEAILHLDNKDYTLTYEVETYSYLHLFCNVVLGNPTQPTFVVFSKNGLVLQNTTGQYMSIKHGSTDALYSCHAVNTIGKSTESVTSVLIICKSVFY
jgi:hypothetical protein